LCSEASHGALKANLPCWCALRLDSTLMQRVEFIEVRYPDRVAA
jgi:hypothetical protein